MALIMIGGNTGWALAGLAAGTVVAWALFGARAALRDSPVLTYCYLASLILLLDAAVRLEPNATVALFVIQPQVWLLIPTVWMGTAWSVGATVVAYVAALSTGVVDPTQMTLVMAGTLTYGLVLGS